MFERVGHLYADAWHHDSEDRVQAGDLSLLEQGVALYNGRDGRRDVEPLALQLGISFGDVVEKRGSDRFLSGPADAQLRDIIRPLVGGQVGQ